MFDIIQAANHLFNSNVTDCKEILPEFRCEYKIEKFRLPETNALVDFLGLKPERDKISITFASDTGLSFISNDVVWTDSYNAFVSDVSEDDEITVSVVVTKGFENGRVSVYNLEEFSQFLCGLKIERVFENFTMLFKSCGERISFQLLDTNGSLRTSSIVFSDNDIQWVRKLSREELLKTCEEASVFLERTRIRLIPQDFEIAVYEGSGFQAIHNLFDNLKSILSYIYLANTATIIDNKAILQFSPTDKGYEYSLEELTMNRIVPQIYEWAFREDSCIDKASIARRIISTYCPNKESILTIDEKILNSIKSDYVIYQKNHVDQYIEMKNRISDYIANSAERIQDLSHDISEAFRNNFVALIVFLMTVLLTDSIDFSQLFGKEISPKVTAVCVVFTIATILYFIVTIIMGNQKWSWLKQSYFDLKKNYESVFVAKDIEEAFNHDEPLNNAEIQYKRICKGVGCAWIILIVMMMIITGVLLWHGQNYSVQQTKIVEQGPGIEEKPIEIEGDIT